MNSQNSLLVSILLVPGVIALLLLCVFSYLYQQSRKAYFRAWQLGWAAYLAAYILLGIHYTGHASLALIFASKLFFTAMIFAIFISAWLIEERFKWSLHHWAIVIAALAWNAWSSPFALHEQPVVLHAGNHRLPADPVLGLFVLLAISAWRFFAIGNQRKSAGLKLLASALLFWGLLLLSRQIHPAMTNSLGNIGHFLGPLPQMMVGLAMVMVLYENERRLIEENLISFSHVEMEFSRVLTLQELAPNMEKLLERLCAVAETRKGILYILEPFRKVLPSAQIGFPEDLLEKVDKELGPAIASLLKIKSDDSSGKIHRLSVSVLSSQADPRLVGLAEIFKSQGAEEISVMALETRDQRIAVLLLPHGKKYKLGGSQRGLLLSFTLQLGTTLGKYVLLHDAQRRGQEFALLTEIGQVVSSRLDQDEVLSAIHEEFSKLMDTSNFYIAFISDDKVRFEFETENGVVLPKRQRTVSNGFTEHMVRTGRSLLIEADLERVRDNLGVVSIARPAKCFCGVPIIKAGEAIGVMAALHYQREYVYSHRDLEMMETAARQVVVAMENARLFSQEHKRARYLAFLNSVSKMAISSQDAEEMLAKIVHEIQSNFNFDHIGVGIVDYNTKEIEIKAEAGSTAKALGRKIPLGVGIMGRVARTNEMALAQGTGEHLLGIIPDSRSVLCLPITYGETLLGILNVESQRESAFLEDEILILKTLADLLATALHNVFVYQRMEQQSITDPLTGIKTRRFFNEALQSEYKRAMRSGRPFSLVLMDLDKFKEVNDGMGHLEGDLVLARIGRLLDQKVRQSNVVARYGGDEFVILMPETGMEQACILSERLRLWIATDSMLNERHVTGSFGVAEFPLHGAAMEDIIRVADAGMYISKHAGGNKVSHVEPSQETMYQGEQRQVIAAYLEAFLRRDYVPSAEDIVGAMSKIELAVTDRDPTVALMDAARTINRTVESREMHASGHGEIVASYADAVGRELSFSEQELRDLVFAAQVHDLGKIILPEKLLNKAGALTFDEFQLVKSHAAVGAQILGTIPGAENAQKFVLHHQERFDGGGYPEGLKGEEIPLGARIVAVAEAYVNMTADRPYANGKTPAEAMQELEKFSGTQFDGMLVRVLIKQLKGERAARS